MTLDQLKSQFAKESNDLLAFALDPRGGDTQEKSFKAVEAALIPLVFALGRTAVMIFLAAAEQRLASTLPPYLHKGGRRFRKVEAKGRTLECWFGCIRYWRTYMAEVAKGGRKGFHPLDVTLGLTKDRISITLLAACVRLATKLSYAQARAAAGWFLPTVPSIEVIEQSVLGFGRYTSEWFKSQPAPEGDGHVLVILVDSKGIPTATADELKKRRRKRRKLSQAVSPRHRGRAQRGQWSPKKRRKKGDKSKNAKMATLVVMYTLNRQGRCLLGPINRWVFGSFAPKKYAFQIARREANKRGFTPGSGRLIQILTDGDLDLEAHVKTYFPEAIHTLDVIHAIEKIWEAGACLFPEGSDELKHWIEHQKQDVYQGRVSAMIAGLVRHYHLIPKTGPGNKGKRNRLEKVIDYLRHRITLMNYDELIAKDLEISTGQVEGAVRYTIGLRCDFGGMRWIKERAEAILQLRCIDINGDWEKFVDYVHDHAQREADEHGPPIRIQQQQPSPLPELLSEAA